MRNSLKCYLFSPLTDRWALL